MAEQDIQTLEKALGILYEDGYEAVMPYVHPEFRMETLPGLAAEPQLYQGREGLRHWWESFYEVMDEIRFEPIRFHPGSERRVAVEFRLHARGQSSGVETTQEAVAVATMRDGMLERFDFSFSLEEALEAINA